MKKMFLEVFPDLNIAKEFEELLKLVEVERVSMSRDRSSIRIYIVSPRLIHKKAILDLEKGIKDQLFYGKQVTIRVFEKFRLSDQYTPEKLLQVYKDSILMELKNYSIIEYNMFRKASFSFPKEDIMELTIEDNAVVREKEGELKRVLEKIFHERCGLPVEIRYQYVEESLDKQVKQREAQILREAQEVFRHTRFYQESGQQQAKASGMSMEKTAEKPVSKQEESSEKQTSAFSKGGQKNFQKDRKFGYQKRSDNPDVLYGRDFEEEFITINQISGEMGEVTIRGKIIATDSRLLASGKTIVIFDVTDFTDTITVKLFVREEALDDVNAAVVKGNFLKLKGMTTIDKFDGELTIGSVVGMKKCEDFTGKRNDNSLEKRVELHCHTKMSDMDGVSDVKDIVKRAKKWGMPGDCHYRPRLCPGIYRCQSCH